MPEEKFERILKNSFESLFHALHRYAFSLLKDNEMAGDVVRSVFLKWRGAKVLPEDDQKVKSYLFAALYRHCLECVREEKTKRKRSSNLVHVPDLNNRREPNLDNGLQRQIQNAIEALPLLCRIIFCKSRMEEKKYVQIASELNLSVKTVEAKMGKALKIMRDRLMKHQETEGTSDHVLITKFIAGEASHDEAIAVYGWMEKSNENRLLFIQMEHAWYLQYGIRHVAPDQTDCWRRIQIAWGTPVSGEGAALV